MLKKTISILVTVASLLTILSLVSFAAPVSSDGGEVRSYSDLVAALGGEDVGELRYDEDGNVDHFYLIKDVSLSAPIVICEGKYKIIGAGSIIRSTSDEGTMFVIKGEETLLALGDSKQIDLETVNLTLDGKNNTVSGAVINVQEDATLELYTGVMIEDAITSSSGAAVNNAGNFIMYGGIFKNCRAVGSGGVLLNKGDCILALGSISDCSANNGGAVVNEGQMSLVGTKISKCSAVKGGFLYNTGSFKLISSTITECKANEGAGIYNLGTLDMEGGNIKDCVSVISGGGIYNEGTVNMKGGTLDSNNAKNGGSIYNVATLNISDQAQVFGGEADMCGANVYNASDAAFNFSGGSISSGISKYGAGIYNFGTMNMSGGGVYSNQATVAEGILNHGTLKLSGMGYVGDNDDIYVVVTEDNKHAVQLNGDWSYKIRKLNLSCGTFIDGKYEYFENEKDMLITPADGVDISSRFVLFNKESKFVISDDGILEKAPAKVSSTVFIVIGVILAFAATVTVIVATVRYFDKKRLLTEE